MQTSAGVDVRKLEAEDDDAPMKLPTVTMDLRLAIGQARQVSCGRFSFSLLLSFPSCSAFLTRIFTCEIASEYQQGKKLITW